MHTLPRQQLAWAAAFLLASPALTQDTEWPPLEDAVDASTPVPAAVQMGQVSITVPSSIAPWLTHGHVVTPSSGSSYTTYPLFLTFGDLVGPDDGELQALILMPRELVVAGTLSIDWQLLTGTFTPLWVWNDPSAAVPPQAPPADHGIGSVAEDGWNAMIWDFDGDGSNEVAFVGKATSNPSGADALYVVRTDPTPTVGPFGIDMPEVLASKTFTPPAACQANFHGSMWLGNRVGVCRVRDTEGRRDIVTHAHHGRQLQVFGFDPNGSGGYALTQLYQRDCYTDDNDAGTDKVVKTHEFNYEDIDGDGFDEFFMNGVIDFVDADTSGLAVPHNTTNPSSGLVRWVSGMSGVAENHIDQMLAADFDPTHPGLEINSVPSLPFTPMGGTPVGSKDLLWSTDGTVLHANGDAPAGGGQSMSIGNWSSARSGLETIYMPKDAPDGNSPKPPFLSWTYSTSALVDGTGTQEELTFDGAAFPATSEQRAGGPVFALSQIDWDGDYSSDEIADLGWNVAYVWRMGEKGDWLPGSMPAGMPSMSQVTQTWDLLGNVPGPYSWYWYTSKPQWNWNFGGPGRYSHYFQKLGEAFGGNRWAMKAYDVGRDYREELVTFRADHNNSNPGASTALFRVFYNLATLTEPWQHPSPRVSKLYRQLRCEAVGWPIVYQDLPVAESLVVTPYTVGMDALTGTQQMAATLVYSDGSTLDVTPLVSWQNEFSQVLSLSSSGLATAAGIQGSSKVSATLGALASKAAYVYASASNEPAILSAGYEDSYLVSTSVSNPAPEPALRVQARIAQRQNQALLAGMLLPSGAFWPYPVLPIEYVGLYDDGQALHGDDLAGDGIYSQVVPYAGHTSLLGVGDNLRVIEAAVAASPSVTSRPWPYLVQGTGWTLIDITGQFDNDAQGEAGTPRIASAGWRGFDDPNYAVLEAEVVPVNDPDVTVYLEVSVNGGAPQLMTALGTSYLAIVPIGALAPGTYLVDVVAKAYHASTGLVAVSDHWPRVRTH